MPTKPTVTRPIFERAPFIAAALHHGVLGKLILANLPKGERLERLSPRPTRELAPNDNAIIIATARGLKIDTIPQTHTVSSSTMSLRIKRVCANLGALNRDHLTRRAIETDCMPGLKVPAATLGNWITPRHIVVAGMGSYGHSAPSCSGLLGMERKTILRLAATMLPPDYTGPLPMAAVVTESFRSGMLTADDHLPGDFVYNSMARMLDMEQNFVVPEGLLPGGPVEWRGQVDVK